MSSTNELIQIIQPENKRTYSVPEVAGMLQISRSKAYELCKENQFSVIKIGKSVRISKKSFDSWLDYGGI